MLPYLRLLAAGLSCCMLSASHARAQLGFDESIRHELQPGDLEIWRDWLRPSAEDAAWMEAIPWLPSFAEGIEKANEAAKPLLLWVMNGHPLGCT